jgi:hypothetical protein
LGVPLASAIYAYVAAKWGSDLTTGYPIIDAVIAAFFAFLITWLAAFCINLWRQAAKLYFEEKDRADGLAERLQPKLRVSFNMNDPGCVRRNVMLTDGKRGDWYRLKVESMSDVGVEGCSARLIDIHRGHSPILIGETPRLSFALTEHPFDARVAARVPSFVDLLLVHESNHANIALPTGDGLASIDPNALFSLPSDYSLRVAVSWAGGGTIIETFLFRWTQDRVTASIEPA